MQFTYYGHSCFAVNVGGKKLLFDPFISANSLAQHIDIQSIRADYILVSHGHGDHIADVVAIADNTGATVIGAFEVVNWLANKGVKKTHGMNFGSYGFDFGRLSFVPAWHSSSMPDGSYGGNPGGFVVVSADGNFYYSGDTALMMDMQLIPHYAQLDFAVLPIGGNFTMDATDAVKAAGFIKCDKIVGVHYNTFPPVVVDVNKVKDIFKMADKELVLPAIGEQVDL
jgi:L-ascorbate metabolism protein UlaG (beta-lactamase superfamily)